MTRKLVTIFALVMLMLGANLAFTTVVSTDVSAHEVYTDVPDNHVHHVAIDWARSAGVAFGYGDGTFRPEASVSRAEFATMLGRTMRVKRVEGTCFSDMTGYDVEMREYVCALAKLGIIHGYGDGRFGPQDTVLLVQEISLITRVKQFQGCWPSSAPDSGIYPNVTGDHRADLLVYASKNGQGVYDAPNNHAPLPRAYESVNRGLTVELLMNSFWLYSQGDPC